MVIPAATKAALLMSSDGYLPTAAARGDAVSAPQMEFMGALMLDPDFGRYCRGYARQ